LRNTVMIKVSVPISYCFNKINIISLSMIFMLGG
jgi:predicted DNA-binding ribbon-helix-helix protein